MQAPGRRRPGGLSPWQSAADGIVRLEARLLPSALLAQRHAIGTWPAGGWRTRAGVPHEVIRAAVAQVGWEHEQTLASVSDAVVIMVRAPGGEDGVLKVATRHSGVASVRRERRVLDRLLADDRLGAWRDLLPTPLRAGEVPGGTFLLTSRLPGQDARHVPPALGGRLTSAAVAALASFHRLAEKMEVVDASILCRLVDEPADQLRAAVGGSWVIDRLVGTLRAHLSGQRLMLGWTHGDFSPRNVLVDTAGLVTGIVDWSQMRERDPIALDVAFWLLTVPEPGQHREFGARVAARLGRSQCWTSSESHLLGTDAGTDPATGRALLLLTWLRHMADKLTKAGGADGLLWSRRNVVPVLKHVASE